MVDLEVLSKVAYAATILFSFKLWFLAYKTKKRDKFIRNLFVIYNILVPLYAAFALMYVFSYNYSQWWGFVGWTTINTLFLVTDGMLLSYVCEKRGCQSDK